MFLLFPFSICKMDSHTHLFTKFWKMHLTDCSLKKDTLNMERPVQNVLLNESGSAAAFDMSNSCWYWEIYIYSSGYLFYIKRYIIYINLIYFRVPFKWGIKVFNVWDTLIKWLVKMEWSTRFFLLQKKLI